MRDKIETALSVLGSLALLVLLALLRAFVFMLLLGAAHSYDGRVPDLGIGAALALSLAVSVVTYQPSGKSE